MAFDHDAAGGFYEGYASQIAMSRAEREALFDASLHHALRYVVYGGTAARWRRIIWADEHRRKSGSWESPLRRDRDGVLRLTRDVPGCSTTLAQVVRRHEKPEQAE